MNVSLMAESFDVAQDGSKDGEQSRTICPDECAKIFKENFSISYESGKD